MLPAVGGASVSPATVTDVKTLLAARRASHAVPASFAGRVSSRQADLAAGHTTSCRADIHYRWPRQPNAAICHASPASRPWP
uniref:Uncharacterized protein n=1 Tax=Oryza barthii TaxID=65489 RepID=A0A0D3G2R7_9ORYZ